MNSERLNAAGKIIDEALLENGLQVYFYKPPTQEETTHKDRKRKHLSFYHGPAKITGKPRDRQYTLEYQGKEFTRDISMIVQLVLVLLLGLGFGIRVPRQKLMQ